MDKGERAMKTACLIALLGAVPPAALAADLPAGDCKRPAARTDLSACDWSRAKLAGKSAAMRGTPDLMSKPEVGDPLRARVRGLAKAPGS